MCNLGVREHLRLLLVLPGICLAACSDTTSPTDSEVEDVDLRIELVAGGGQFSAPGGSLSEPIVLKVSDQHDAPQPGTVLEVELSSGGSINPPSVQTGSDGLVTLEWRLGPELGMQRLNVRIPGGDADQVEVEAEALPGVVEMLEPGEAVDLTTPNGARVRIPESTISDPIEVVVVDRVISVGEIDYAGVTLLPYGYAIDAPLEIRFPSGGGERSGIVEYVAEAAALLWVPSGFDEGPNEVVGVTDYFGTYLSPCTAAEATCPLGRVGAGSHVIYTVSQGLPQEYASDIERAFQAWEAALEPTGITFSRSNSPEDADLLVTVRSNTRDAKRRVGDDNRAFTGYDIQNAHRFIVLNDSDYLWEEAESTRGSLEEESPHQRRSVGDAVQHQIGHHLGFVGHHEFWTCDADGASSLGRDECVAPPVMAAHTAESAFSLPLGCLDLERLAAVYEEDAIRGRCFSQVEVVQGDGGRVAPGESVLTNPMVRLLDSEGRPVSGISVAFVQAQSLSTAGVGSVSGGVTISDSDGYASVEEWRVGEGEGQGVLDVWIGSQPQATFKVTVREPIGFEALQVSAGRRHTCAVGLDHRAYCWGENLVGQLGTADTRNRAAPAPVITEEEFASVTAGYNHSCGLTPDGRALCWGWNENGQLGNGTTDFSLVPVAVESDLRFSRLEATGNWQDGRSCGLATDGHTYCWGMVGHSGWDDDPEVCYPTRVEGGVGFSSLSIGERHNCGLDDTGIAYCWAGNPSLAAGRPFGQWGDRSYAWADEPVPVEGGHHFLHISAGERFTCGVTTEGEGLCWGGNFRGRLGDGTEEGPRYRPAPLVGDLQLSSIGAYHHGCALSEEGAAHCWGDGAVGGLGDGTFRVSLEPVAVAGGHTFQSLSVGAWYACAIAEDDVVYCWGGGTHRQLGQGEARHSSTPTPVSMPDE